MENRIKYFILVFLTIMLILVPFSVKASDNITLQTSKTDLEVGDELTVSASMPSGVKAYAILATLKFDENVFEKIDNEDFEKVDETLDITYNKQNNKFGIINKSGEIDKLFTVHLRVKEDANVGNTNIALTNISSSDGTVKKTYPTVSKQLSITRDAIDGETLPVNKENEIIEDEESEIKVFTVMPIIYTLIGLALALLLFIIILFVKLKNADKKKPFFFLIAFEVVLIIAIIILYCINGNKKDVNNDGVQDYDDAKAIIQYLIGIDSEERQEIEGLSEDSNQTDINSVAGGNGQTGGSSKQNQNKPSGNSGSSTNSNGTASNENNGDNVNGGNNTNDDNTNTNPSKDNQNGFEHDTNGDGKVDVNDAGHSAGQTTEKSKVSLSEEEKSDYIEKGKVTLKFKADITPKGTKISKVKIDGEYYEVELESDVYSVTLDTPDVAGKCEFVISEVMLNNKKEVKAELKFEREVLKDIPTINMFNMDEEKKTLSFKLKDDDNALKSGRVTIYDKDDTQIKNMKLEAENVIEYEFIEDEIYHMDVVGTYDLDSNKEDQNNLYEDRDIFNHTFIMSGNYNFALTDVAITDIIQKEEKPVVSFTSTNTKNAKIEQVTVDSENYIITKTDGTNYEVELTDADTSFGKHTVNLDNVILSTMKTFENNKDYTANTLTYSVLKEKPEISNITLTEDRTAKNIHVSYSLTDTDDTIKDLTVVLVDSTGKIVSSNALSKEELKNSAGVDLSYDKNSDGRYTVRFLANYELGDKYTYTNTSIGEKEISILDEQNIYIRDITVKTPNNNYPSKGQKKYEISINVFVSDEAQKTFRTNHGWKETDGQKYARLSAVTVNGLNYVVEQERTNEPNIYKSRLSLTVPNESGVLDVKINRIQLEYTSYYTKYNDFYSVNEKSIQIDVLKDVPKIENLKANDDYDARTATFDFDVVLDEKAKDGDESFKNGSVTLNEDTKTINRGHNSITFDNVTKDQNFDLIFKASYDLDTDTFEGADTLNEYTDKEIHKVKYGLFDKNTYEDIKIIDEKAISEQGNKYFEKNEKIKLNFKVDGINEDLQVEPQRVVIDGEEYTLTKLEDSLEVVLDGYSSSGEKEIKITDIILNNGKQITLKNPCVIKPEVLKDVISISDYKYEVLGDEIKVTLATKDYDTSLVGKVKVKITGKADKIIYDGEHKPEITLKKDDSTRYYLTVTCDYDRDIDKQEATSNFNKDFELLKEIISLDENNIELREIIDINLYKTEKDGYSEKTVLIDTVRKEELEENLDSYFVEINMENMPSVRAKIQSVMEEDGHLILVLNYKYVTSDNTYETRTVRIDYGEIIDGVATNNFHPDKAFKSLLEKLKNNETITLNQNYDASALSTEGNSYVETYSGTLNGNGYTIKNLDKPLFDKLTGTVNDLKLENIYLGTSAYGSLASNTDGAKISGVLVDRVTKPNSDNSGNGGLVGRAKNTTIEKCRVINASIGSRWDIQQNGVFIGSLEGSVVSNCYAIGAASGGNYTCSFVGHSKGSTLTNNFVKADMRGFNGFTGEWASSSSICKNNVVLINDASIDFVSGLKQIDNNYYYGANGTAKEMNGVKAITKEEINKDLFVDKAKFDESIWLLDNVSYDNPPIFQVEKTNVFGDNSFEDYDEAKETLYKNLMRLMPFYDNDKIIKTAKNISDVKLNTQEIAHILPVDKNGDIVTYLTNTDVKKISKIKVVYKNEEKSEYDVIYDNTYDMVASYHIPALDIDYTYNHYVIDASSQVVNNLTNYLSSLDYTNNLDILTNTSDSRIYRDFYNETTKKELKEFVLKFLSNSNYTNTTNDEDINNYIEREIKKDKKIEKVLYMYNYIKRWYSLDIDGMDLSDFMLFNMQGFNEKLTPMEITNMFFKSDSNFNTNETNTKYASIFGTYTNMNTLATFLEYMVTEFGSGNLHEWTREQFKGYLVEIPVEGHQEIQYTLWDHFSHENGSGYKVYNFILPILTLPKNAAYIISSPVQFIIGAQRTYIVNPDDPQDQAKLQRRVKSYTDRMKDYYDTAYKILKDEKLFNAIHTYHTDKRYTYDLNGVSTYQQPYVTEEPFHKNFNEVVGQWAYSDGNAAVAWGDRIDWSAEGVMDGNLIPEDGTVYEYTYHTWSHESAHNIDSRLFLRNNGRRFDAGGEDYADSNLMQYFGPNEIVMNLSVHFKKGDKVGSNYEPSRIDSQAKVKDYYEKVFKTIYVMDYIEAQSFLKLTPDEMKSVAVQVTYPNEEAYKDDPLARYRAYHTTRYIRLSNQQENKMDLSKLKSLNTIEDLYDNRISLYPGVEIYSTLGDNRYGGEGLQNVHWYQPHNDYGRPDSYSIKWFAYEMLGYAGYDGGYIEYFSNIHSEKAKIYSNLSERTGESTVDYKTDLMALKRITKYDSFKEYKMARFKEVEDNIECLNTAVNVQEYIDKMYKALVKDAENCQNPKNNKLDNSTELRREIYYNLKEATNDFTSDIYSGSKTQDVTGLKNVMN